MNRLHTASPGPETVDREVLICKAFANSTRLRILDLLAEHDRHASELKKELAIAGANLSQHMTAMKAVGIILRHRDGKGVLFSLAMPEVKKARRLIRDIVRIQIRRGRRLAVGAGRI